MASRVTTGTLVTRILCVLALVCLAFAHKPPAFVGLSETAVAQVDLAQYVLPDGTLPVICHPNANTEHPDHQMAGSGCEACRISASILLPEPGASARFLNCQIRAQMLRDDVASSRPVRLLPGTGPQAPPVAV